MAAISPVVVAVGDDAVISRKLRDGSEKRAVPSSDRFLDDVRINACEKRGHRAANCTDKHRRAEMN